ncbi:MAG TPA: DUF1707 domain-containing protein [Streptosporangiaceae bacterium]|nr:DUF1707 domain-containing protein [Streptosporangiaceae bacterium]
MTGPGYEQAVAVAGRGHLRASRADREQMIDALKAAFVQGRLTKDEFDARVTQTLVSRTYAELATVIANLPAEPARPDPPRTPARRPASNAVRWVASGSVTPVIVAAAYVLASLRGGGGYEVVAFVIASVYFIFWLSAGADLLWQWHSMSSPGTGMCVRCAHTAASHRAPASCVVRLGSLKSRRCSCSGYVPPGLSPKAADPRLLSTR